MTNPHTGAKEQTPPASDSYREGWGRIFGKKECQHNRAIYTDPVKCMECGKTFDASDGEWNAPE